MRRIRVLHLLVAFALALCFAPAQTSGQNVYHVRPGATGSNNGSDWNNAFTALPSTFVRGATYYVADGAYGGRTFNTAAGGTALITIKKATPAEHGSDTGWQNTYGDGVAQFNGQINFTTGYWVFDGVTGGGPGSWTSGFGFKVVETGGQPAIATSAGQSGRNVRFITIKHVEVQGNDGSNQGGGGLGNDAFAFYGGGNILVSYAYAHDMGRCIIFGGSDSTTFEYMYTGDFTSTDATHAEIASIWNLAGTPINNWTFRYCVFTHSEGTGGLMFDGRGMSVYGCVFYQPAGANWDAPNGLIGGWTGNGGEEMHDVKVYNNSFITVNETSLTTLPRVFSGCEARNNLWYNCSSPSFSKFPNHDFNHFINSGGAHAEANGTSASSGNPFVDFVNLNFALTADTAPADPSVSATYRTDMFGRVGLTRGAVQFSGIVDVIPPTVSLNSPPSGAAVSNIVTLSAAASDGGGSGVATITFFVDGVPAGTDTSSPYSLSWDSRTVPNGSHVLLARASDAAGNQATSASITVSVQNVIDDTPPTVALTSPTAGSIVSNSVVLSASASDAGSGVARVEFLVGGAVVATDATAPYSVTWNSHGVVNGTRSIQARAVDVAGNASTSASVGVTVQNVVAPVLVHLAFNETSGNLAADASGYGNNGALEDGGNWTSGRLAGALALDGVDDSVRVPSSPTLESTTNALTICAWVKVEANGQWQAIARKLLQDGTHVFPYSAYDLIIEEMNGIPTPRMAVSRGNGIRATVYASSGIAYNQWVHLTGIYDGTVIKIFVNGSEVGSTPFSGTVVRTDQPLLIGRNGIGGDQFQGVIDDFRLYNRALSPAELQTIVNPVVPASPLNLRLVAGN